MIHFKNIFFPQLEECRTEICQNTTRFHYFKRHKYYTMKIGILHDNTLENDIHW